jgi:hypothetical protein
MNSLILTKNKNIFAYTILLITVFPNIIWIFLDKSVFPWDQAWYGQVSVELFYHLTHSPIDWVREMISAFGAKAPGIAWVGQFFVPIGQLINSVDIGLLLSILVTQSITLFIVYHIILRLTDSRLISIICCLFVSSSPLSIGLTHQYFVEPLQTLGIAWIILIMVSAPQWESNKIILHLASAISLAMLAKVSSPLYFFSPVLVISHCAYSNRNANKRLIGVKTRNWLSKIKIEFLPIATFLLVTGALLWYGKNLQSILLFALNSSSGETSLYYGEKGDFFNKIHYWLLATQKNFLSPISLTFILSLTFYIFSVKILKIKGNLKLLRLNYFDICVMACFLEIISILAILSLNVNQENRYLLPILPHLAIIMSWILKKVNQNAILVFIGSLFTLQLLVFQSQALGITGLSPNLSPWLYSINTNDDNKQLLTEVIHTTCNTKEQGKYNIIGLELPQFNANSASYFSAQQLLTQSFHCYYTSLGYAEKNPEKAWKKLLDMNINYFVTLKQSSQPKSVDFLNKVSSSILDKVKNSTKFKLQSSVNNQLILYKQVSH